MGGWSGSLKAVVKFGNSANFLDFISNVARRINRYDLKLFCIICCRLWSLRNSFVYEGKMPIYSDVIWWSRHFADNCKAPFPVISRAPPIVTRGPQRWGVPAEGIYKINCSMKIDTRRNMVGFGIVIKDGFGSVMASFSQTLASTFDAYMAGNLELWLSTRASCLATIVVCFLACLSLTWLGLLLVCLTQIWGMLILVIFWLRLLS